MRLLRRPFLWAVLLAALFAVTISGNPPVEFGDAAVDMPSPDELAEGRVDGPEVALAAARAVPAVGGGTEELVMSGAELSFAEESAGEEHVGGPTEEELQLFEAQERPRILLYTVKQGETLSAVAARFNIGQETLLAANDLPNANLLRAGEQLKVPRQDGALHKVQRGESLWDIARIYRVDMNEIVRANGLTDPNRLYAGQEIFIPGAEAASISLARRTERLVSADGKLLQAFSWPVSGRLSSRYGMRWGAMHHGIDIAVPTGTAVRAAAAGRVSFAGWNGGYGNLVVIDHGNSVETRYAHNSRLVVKVGQQVRRGDIIAYSGSTGRSTGPHVHFEIRQRGQSVNPLNYLR